MSVGGEPGRLFSHVTQRSGYRYFFYQKHHGRGGPEAAQWATDTPHPPERPLPRDALQRMVDAQLLTNPERKRLLKGKII